MITNNTTSNYIIENSFDSLQITIHGQKKWGWFISSLLLFLVNGLCFLPIVGLMLFVLSQKYLPEIFQGFMGVLLLGLFLYVLYVKFRETIEYVFDKEHILINHQSITIEKSGFLGLKNKKVFSAENIHGIATSFSFTKKVGFLNRLAFASGAFMIWSSGRRKKVYNFGKGVSQTDAQNIMDAIYSKFPHYKYLGVF